MTEPAAKPALTAALNRLWVQFLPEIEERVAILESASAALAAHQLSIEQHEAAHAAAHKLAGVLGTFGLAEGTILAREAENLCSAEPGPGSAAAARLTQIAAQLRAIVESRK